MKRWKVRKSPTGDWWAHEPTCNRRGDLVCIIFNECTNCKKFRTAYAYAEYKATNSWRPPILSPPKSLVPRYRNLQAAPHGAAFLLPRKAP